MKAFICKNTWFKSYSNFKFWLFWQQPTALAKMQLYQILLPASQWRIPASQFVYISHIAQPTLTNSLALPSIPNLLCVKAPLTHRDT
jgi:hypothetical protein